MDYKKKPEADLVTIQNKTALDILTQLDSPGAGKAWRKFLDRYASLILRIARQHATSQQGQSDCFLFICEKLADDQFRRLKAYRPDSKSKFTSWLQVVTARLAIDWYRGQHGRFKPFSSLSGISELELEVYRLNFEQGLGFDACWHTLSQKHRELTRDGLDKTIAKIGAMLTPRQRWLISVRKAETEALDEEQITSQSNAGVQVLSEPESELERQQLADRISNAMSKLEPPQRLLIRLRFQQGLTFRQIARQENLGDSDRARYRVQSAVDQLLHFLNQD